MTGRLEVSCVEYHTAGEPFRILSGGFGRLPGADMLAKRRHAREHLDHYRRLVVNEPRGHADMYGCFVTDPVDERAAFGAVFFHNAGYSTACGHGTIALATWAVESGLVPHDQEELHIDVPSGTLRTTLRRAGGELAVTFENVPSWVHSRGHEVEGARADIAYGGAFYASVDAAALGLAVTPEHTARFIELGRRIKAALEARLDIAVPGRPDIAGIYGVTFYEALPDADGLPTQRNITVFADGEVDRSPCGSGTSARLALLHADGLLGGRELRHLSIIGTEFRGRVTGEAGGGVVTEVSGSAHLAGHHVFVRTPGDPLPDGFLLR
jgi:proline racemase/trans-L-3-hydroxyproline dehydratase